VDSPASLLVGDQIAVGQEQFVLPWP
jgi:hypothetical protein